MLSAYYYLSLWQGFLLRLPAEGWRGSPLQLFHNACRIQQNKRSMDPRSHIHRGKARGIDAKPWLAPLVLLRECPEKMFGHSPTDFAYIPQYTPDTPTKLVENKPLSKPLQKVVQYDYFFLAKLLFRN
ncbi:hypothetical protein [Alkalicoccus daliensis]|uniref:hypothetical protein n=1 Tax=Alkalicoccus daliensis TaxID=745820 RepID=UPI000B833D49|nr:hypothetical protein [Alkalicoccus daliensis]